MLLNQDYLSFGEIADRWAQESAGHPAALERDKILERMEDGLRNDEFNYAELTIWRKAKLDDNRNYVLQPEGWRPVTRDILHYTLFRVRNDVTKRILEELRISKKAFSQWCNDQEFSLPEFWPNAADHDALPETSALLSGATRYQEWADRQEKLIEDGQAENYRRAAQQIAASEGVDAAYVERECRRVRECQAGDKREK